MAIAMEEAELGDGGESSPAAMLDPLIRGEALERDYGAALSCSVATDLPRATAEQPEARAYKLGKHKCSYNRVKLIVRDVDHFPPRKLKISEAVQIPIRPRDLDDRLRDSCLKFQVRFTQGSKINLFVLLVYSSPVDDQDQDRDQSLGYRWIPVTRSRCKKADNPCKGPVLRGLQRFGTEKSPRNLYVAIDEASTHVCPIRGEDQASTFRLLLAAYDQHSRLLGSTVSSPIRVFCNNDTPLGAATLKIKYDIKGGKQENLKRTRTPLGDLTNSSSGRVRQCGDQNAKIESPDHEDEDDLEELPDAELRRPRFEPLEQLRSLFSPIQIDYLQNQNPVFLYNFVRYSRELYNTYYRDTPEEVTRPTPKRPFHLENPHSR